MNSAQTLIAISRREFLEGKGAFLYTPACILGFVFVMMILALTGIGTFDTGNISLSEFASGFDKFVEETGDDVSVAVTAVYWGVTFPAWMALPFVIYFGLSGSLYDERKDRSILFFKSMPVSDWQEVIAKLLTIALFGPLCYIAIMLVAQVAIALVLTPVILFNGGPILELWPLFTMLQAAIAVCISIFVYFLWALPLFAWVLLASAASPRVPFLFAALVPAILTVMEVQLFGETHVGNFIADHIGKGMGQITDGVLDFRRIDGPDVLFAQFSIGSSFKILFASLTKSTFWVGIGLAAVFLLGAVEVRRRAS